MFENIKRKLGKWWKSLWSWFTRVPVDRNALIEILHNSEKHNLLDADVLLMIEGALNVSELQVRDIMIPRMYMVIIEHEATLDNILPMVLESGHSRFPVAGEGSNEIVGILLAKDLLNYYANKNEYFEIKDMMRPPVFIPESKRLNMLLHEFRASRNHMAIVIDEYGGASGLVTIEDVIEEIIGEIEDEHDFDETRTSVRHHSKNRYSVRGLTSITEFNKILGSNISNEKYDTIGGFIINSFGHLPKRGESIELDEFYFKVLRADKRRVHLLLVIQRQKKHADNIISPQEVDDQS